MWVKFLWFIRISFILLVDMVRSFDRDFVKWFANSQRNFTRPLDHFGFLSSSSCWWIELSARTRRLSIISIIWWQYKCVNWISFWALTTTISNVLTESMTSSASSAWKQANSKLQFIDGSIWMCSPQVWPIWLRALNSIAFEALKQFPVLNFSSHSKNGLCVSYNYSERVYVCVCVR